MKIIFFCVSLVIIGLFITYLTVNRNTKNVSKQRPYAEVIGRELKLVRPVILAKNNKEGSSKSYFISERANSANSDYIGKLPKGTTIFFHNAYITRSSLTGVVESVLVGNVRYGDVDCTINYHWGKYHRNYKKSSGHYWTFPLAFWQTQADTMEYQL